LIKSENSKFEAPRRMSARHIRHKDWWTFRWRDLRLGYCPLFQFNAKSENNTSGMY